MQGNSHTQVVGIRWSPAVGGQKPGGPEDRAGLSEAPQCLIVHRALEDHSFTAWGTTPGLQASLNTRCGLGLCGCTRTTRDGLGRDCRPRPELPICRVTHGPPRDPPWEHIITTWSCPSTSRLWLRFDHTLQVSVSPWLGFKTRTLGQRSSSCCPEASSPPPPGVLEEASLAAAGASLM